MCNNAIYATILAYAVSYGVRDRNIINAVADEMTAYDRHYWNINQMQSGVIRAFERHGIHMV